MSKYEKVKHWYDTGKWDIDKVRDAVKMGWISEEEYQTITGEAYTART